jgi:RNA polymerase sigma factor (sigma-70 family)
MEEKKGFFKRLVDGLSKTRDNIVTGFDSIFMGYSSIDEDFYEELEETVGGTDPQEFVIGMEIADRIREVYRDLDEKDKQIFSKRFIKNPRMTKSQIAKELGMTRSSVSRRVKKIQERILRGL